MPNGVNVDILSDFKKSYPWYFQVKIIKKPEFADLI
jgi:hypothetical protein